MLSLNGLKKEIIDCSTCSSFPTSGRIKVMGRGNVKAKLILLGEAPGATEERLGKPFVGLAGNLLERILNKIGVALADTYITNVVKTRCLSSDKEKTRNLRPSAAQTAHGLVHLKKEIDLVKPEIIVTLGSTAARVFLGRDFKLSKQRGRFYRWQDTNILPTYHPAYVSRMSGSKNTRILKEFTNDLKKAKEFMKKR